MKRVLPLLTGGILAIAWCQGGDLVQQAPPRAADRSSPLVANGRTLQAGAKLYTRECAACHGAKREGLGKAPPLDGAEVNRAPAGALFWVVGNGSLRNGMPSFAHLPQQQRWQIVTWLLQSSGSGAEDHPITGKRRTASSPK